MTVGKLVERLKEMPQNLMVVFNGQHVDDCKLNYEYYDCDPCRPDADVITVVELI